MSEERLSFELQHDKFRRGMTLKFPNGYVLSSQWGYGSYSSNKTNDWKAKPKDDSTTVEIAIWRENGMSEWRTREIWAECFDEDIDNDVQGHVGITKWLELVNFLRQYSESKS